MRTVLPCLLALLILAGCRSAPADIALGSIEWDRVELVATAAEPITAIAVREGDSIDKDALVLEQRADRAEADLAAAAELDRSGASAELARSELAAARASDDLLRAAELDELRREIWVLLGFTAVMLALATLRFRKRLD